ncbi:MAG: hypothetical protein NTZ84_02655 [Candidatus Nealsonbacteria bacterium]|nr:hypothetical protein [Candidatus Nealsonbacteria bacterium]
MPNWLMYGLSASLFWGTYAIVSKVVTSEKYLGLSSGQASLLMFGGITIVLMGFFLWQQKIMNLRIKFIGILLILLVLGYVVYALKNIGLQLSLPKLGLGLLQGILWAGGMVMAFLALKSGAEAAKLVPIYNTNTLIAVILGLTLLHEVPDPEQKIKVITGAILIVIGGILCS